MLLTVQPMYIFVKLHCYPYKCCGLAYNNGSGRHTLEEGDDAFVGVHCEGGGGIAGGIAFPVVEAVAGGCLGGEGEDSAFIVAAGGRRD